VSALAAEGPLVSILAAQLGEAFALARPRLERMAAQAAGPARGLSWLADHHGPRLITHDREGRRIDEIEYHPAYRQLQEIAYGGGIVAASYDPELARERGRRPKALTFGLGYLFAQAEPGLYCPVCMTDGAARLVQRFGSQELQSRYLMRLASRDRAQLFTGAMFLTERAGGSDVGQVATVARSLEGDGAVAALTGQKWFCSNVDADVVMILARPEGAGPGTSGLGLYLLPRVLPDGQRNRFVIDRLKDKLGVRSMPTGEVTLDGAVAYRLGGPGEGFRQMAEMLNLSRLHNAIASTALMRRALVEALDWATRRVAFGKPVLEHPLLTGTLLDLAAEQRAALRWVFRGVELLDRSDAGEATPSEAQALRLITPLLKSVLARRSVWSALEAMETLGGNGYIEDWPMAQLLRDAQVLPIWEGTTNVLALDAFRAIKKGAALGLFAELERCAADAPADLSGRLMTLRSELSVALEGLGEHDYREWTERASIAWQVGLLSSHGSEGDLRAARRLLSRHLPSGWPRGDRATPEEVRLVAGF
jgi:acyl-CoA dehydrogenase